MLRLRSIALAALGSLAPAAHAQDLAHPCATVVQTSEAASLLGAAVSRPPRDTKPLGRTEAIDCVWGTSDPKRVLLVHLNPVLPGAKLQTAQLAPGYRQLGWKVEVTDDTPGLWCAIVDPGASAGPVARSVECLTLRKGVEVRLNVQSPSVTPAAAKSLLEKIVSRLPGS